MFKGKVHETKMPTRSAIRITSGDYSEVSRFGSKDRLVSSPISPAQMSLAGAREPKDIPWAFFWNSGPL